MNKLAPIPLRRALGKFATGVTVVTCQGPHGITVNSFSSVSLDPPLILWSIARVSDSLEAFLDAERFVVNVLGAGQESLAAHFARTDHSNFDGVEYESTEHGVPVLPGTIARFECRTDGIHEAGDHHIVIGRIERFDADDGAPLLFFGGRYARLR